MVMSQVQKASICAISVGKGMVQPKTNDNWTWRPGTSVSLPSYSWVASSHSIYCFKWFFSSLKIYTASFPSPVVTCPNQLFLESVPFVMPYRTGCRPPGQWGHHTMVMLTECLQKGKRRLKSTTGKPVIHAHEGCGWCSPRKRDSGDWSQCEVCNMYAFWRTIVTIAKK